MNHEVFQKIASQSQLTVEWLAYLVSNLPSLYILTCTISPLIKIILVLEWETSRHTGCQHRHSHNFKTYWMIFSIWTRVVDTCLHTHSACTGKIHTPKIILWELHTLGPSLPNTTKALMIVAMNCCEWRAWPSCFLAQFPTVSTSVTDTWRLEVLALLM